MAATPKLTLEEFLAREETEPASEYACGEVVQKPMPDEWHAVLQLYLGALLLRFLERTKLGRVGSEWRCVFGPPGHQRPYVPGLLYVSNERYERGRPHTRRFLRTAPDLAVEILSPNQDARRFADKIWFYLRHGVRLIWIIDPDERVVWVLRPDAETRNLRSGDVLDGEDVLPGFRVAIDDLFAQLAGE